MTRTLIFRATLFLTICATHADDDDGPWECPAGYRFASSTTLGHTRPFLVLNQHRTHIFACELCERVSFRAMEILFPRAVAFTTQSLLFIEANLSE